MSRQRYAVCPFCGRTVRQHTTHPGLYRHLSRTATKDTAGTQCPNTAPVLPLRVVLADDTGD